MNDPLLQIMKQRLEEQVKSRQSARNSEPLTVAPHGLRVGEEGCTTAHSRSAQQVLLEGESDHVPHFQDSSVSFPASSLVVPEGSKY